MRFDDIFPIPAVIATLSIDKPPEIALEELAMLKNEGFAVALHTDVTRPHPQSSETYRTLKRKRFVKGLVVEENNYRMQGLAKDMGASFIYVPFLPTNEKTVRNWSLHQQQPRPLIIGGISMAPKKRNTPHIAPDAIVPYSKFQQTPSKNELEQVKAQSKNKPILVLTHKSEDATLLDIVDGIIIEPENRVWTLDRVKEYGSRVSEVESHVAQSVLNEFYR